MTKHDLSTESRRPILAPIPARPGNRRRDEMAHYAPRQDGPFQVPREISDAMAGVFKPVRNREACNRLMTWALAANCKRPAGNFTICRDVVSANPAVGLTPDQVRGAIARLVLEGFLERVRLPAYKRNRAGRLIRDDKGRPHREAVEFAFPRWIREALQAAAARRRRFKNKSPTPRPYGSRIDNQGISTRTEERRQSRHADSRHSPLPHRGPLAPLHDRKRAFGFAGGGEGRAAPDSDPGLEAALARLGEGIRGSNKGQTRAEALLDRFGRQAEKPLTAANRATFRRPKDE